MLLTPVVSTVEDLYLGSDWKTNHNLLSLREEFEVTGSKFRSSRDRQRELRA